MEATIFETVAMEIAGIRTLYKSSPVSVRLGPGADFSRRLEKAWTYHWIQERDLYRIRIAPGERFKPSIPWTAYSVIPPAHLEPASLPHDAIYRRQGQLLTKRHVPIRLHRYEDDRWTNVQRVTRRWTDRMFNIMNAEAGVSWWRRRLAFRAVRIFGGPVWKEIDATTA